MTTFLKTLLQLSVAGTLCGLFLILLRKISKGKIPGSFLYIAWIVVILRFAIPVNGLIPAGDSPQKEEEPIPAFQEMQQLPPVETQQLTPAEIVPSYRSWSEKSDLSVTNQLESEEVFAAAGTGFFPTVLFCIWCCGMTGVLLWNVIPYIRFSSLLKKSLLWPTQKDICLYDEVCRSWRPGLARSGMISAPLTFGLFRHIIVIPDMEYASAALKYVFSHEIVHFKRHDILLKWITLIIFSAHWFNPFVWYFRKETDKVCELSCDEVLLRKMNAEEKHRYGETLLIIAEKSCRAPNGMVTGFSEGKKDLKERLLYIMSFKKKSKIAIVMALIPVLVLCGCALALGPRAEKGSDRKIVEVSDINEFLEAIAPDTEIRMMPGIYNLTEASDYGKENASAYYRWNNYGYDGQYELCVENIDGLSIVGENAEILTIPRSSNVFAFNSCDGLSLHGLTIGHTEAAQACEGGVIRLESCVDTVIDHCGLYGCGTFGVWAERSSRIKVSNTDIYHCSAAGISFSEGRGLSVENCNIYDCGRSEKYQDAAAAFIFYNAPEVIIKNCDIHDNYLQNLIQGNAEDISFEDIRVNDNHISTAFHFDGDVQFRNVSFTDNTIDKWMAEYRTGSITIDGKKYSEEDLTTMWGEQMSAAGIGAVETEMAVIDRTGTKEVHVKTADEFLSTIASDTTVYIDVPQIDLTSASNYGENASEDWGVPEIGSSSYAWVNCYEGYELFIGNVKNFHIVGGEIVTQPRYANVLNYISCSDVTLENVHLGHTPEQGVCVGGVLNLQDSDNIILEGCDLYGCGILGIRTQNVRELHVQNTLIHDCSNGAAMLEDSDNIVFLGCDVVNCPNPHFFLSRCENFSWDGKLMDPHSSFNVNDDAKNPFEAPAVPIDFNVDLQDDEIHDREIAANVVCIITDAYFKGNRHIISGYIAQNSPLRDADEIKTYDGSPADIFYYMGDGELVSCELSYPADLVKNLNFIEGLDDIGDNEPDGTGHQIKVHYWKENSSTGDFEKDVLELDLIREDDCWRVVNF